MHAVGKEMKIHYHDSANFPTGNTIHDEYHWRRDAAVIDIVYNQLKVAKYPWEKAKFGDQPIPNTNQVADIPEDLYSEAKLARDWLLPTCHHRSGFGAAVRLEGKIRCSLSCTLFSFRYESMLRLCLQGALGHQQTVFVL